MLNHSMNLCGILCSWGLMESSAKTFSICCHTGPVGMTKILPPCPCPELCIPAGTGDALIPQLLGWAPDPQVLFNTPPFLTGFILWMDKLLTIPIPHLECIFFFFSPNCPLLCLPIRLDLFGYGQWPEVYACLLPSFGLCIHSWMKNHLLWVCSLYGLLGPFFEVP